MKYVLLFCLCLVWVYIDAQQETISIQPSYGLIFKHSPAYKPRITEASQGLSISYMKRKMKGSPFYQKFNYPAIGVHLIACRFGDNDIFGNSLSVSAAFHFYLMEKQRWNLMLTTGMGLGYVSREYDAVDNQTNNVIGSHINMTPHIGLSSQIFLSPQIALQPMLGIVHHSNGHIQLPNLGINYIHGSLGLGYVLHNKFKKDSFVNNGQKIQRHKNELTACIGLSDRGSQDDRHILPTYALMYHRLFYTSDINVLKAGASIEYKNNDYDYKWYRDEQNTDIALVVGDELFFGRLSFNILIGVYVYSELAFEKKKYSYQRWGLSYRIPTKSKKMEWITGAHLKVHYGAAELTEARLSMLF